MFPQATDIMECGHPTSHGASWNVVIPLLAAMGCNIHIPVMRPSTPAGVLLTTNPTKLELNCWCGSPLSVFSDPSATKKAVANEIMGWLLFHRP
jgi:hypothetical protein